MHARKTDALALLAFAHEALGDTAHLEHLERPRMQAAGAGADQLLVEAPLEDGHIDAGELELGRQRHAGRPAAGDHHRVFLHHFSCTGPVSPDPSWAVSAGSAPFAGIGQAAHRARRDRRVSILASTHGRLPHFIGVAFSRTGSTSTRANSRPTVCMS